MRIIVGAVAVLVLSAGLAAAAPLTCEDLVEDYAEQREELGLGGVPLGQNIFAGWQPGDSDYRYSMSEDSDVEVRLVCASDGLFERFTVTTSWIGEPKISDWMLAQTPADVVAVAIRKTELGPNLADLLDEALDQFIADKKRGFGEASESVDATFEAAVRFELQDDLQRISYIVRRSEIE